jgi:hypothetical protein
MVQWLYTAVISDHIWLTDLVAKGKSNGSNKKHTYGSHGNPLNLLPLDIFIKGEARMALTG